MAQRTCDQPGCERKHLARGACKMHYNLLHTDPAKRWPKEIRSCAVCNASVLRRVDNHHVTTCSVPCRTFLQFGETSGDSYDWATDAAARARKFGAIIVQVVRREDVFARDGGRCQSCDIVCTEPDPFTLTAATVDHVVPLSEGGEHSMANTRTLCLSCNSARQAGISPAA